MRDGPALRLALAAIRGYQRWISPYKGYRCALCAVTGGESCSNYGFRVIERFGLRRGLGLLDRRFELCGHVHRRLAVAAQAPSRPHPRSPVRNPWRHKEQGVCDLPCDAPGCDLPDLHCHGGRACGGAGDLLDLASCGCDIADCGRSSRDRSRRCRDRCGPGSSRHRDPAHLDALARRIEERRRRPPS
ncbi:membrane protein insertion efficiency factor YidD [Massilia sp. Bi118]|uniref:membrane protein insertion efficiency factor YidD n=1 Tax=Massilia sp. Bi118 TaxID=2822346 RepID=UPI001E40FF2A|nr:membrane protein insertion efficiency factor YidD [Massilia sp. Bi118]